MNNNPQYDPNNQQQYQQQYQQPNQQQYQQPYQQPYQPPYQQPGVGLVPPPGAKGKAIASMVCGIIAAVICWFGFASIIAIVLSIVAIVLGVMARKQCPVGYQGRGMATAGLVLGIVSLVLSVIGLVCWISVCSAYGAAVSELAEYGYWG